MGRGRRGLAHDEATVSDDPFRPADLTALTYQAVSVLDTAQPFTALARARWADELVGDERTPDQAHDWLDALNEKNPAAYRRGIRSRSRSVRRTLARQDAAALTSALHPRARDLMDRLVEAGVETIVLDECHHLLDHWALVVAALVARIRAEGREPLVVGLTATLPSPDDANEYDNYVSLLGEVDLEVPVPAVVREGDLAPYRELVHAVEPTDEERAFLSAHAAALDEALRTTFAVGAGREYLRDALQPPAAATAPIADPLAPPSAPRDVRTSTSVGADLARIDRGLAEAFSADFARAEAAAAMFSEIAPDDPLVARLPAVARRAPTTDETVRLLGRYALDRVLPDPDRQADWRRLRRLLADFGYALTDRGVRRTRDPIDTVLASSLAKDRGACDILAVERAQLGDRLRALVVTDFVTHGNVHGGLLGSAGAVRTFSVLSTDAGTAALRAVLITSSTVRVSTRHAPVILPALTRELGAELETIPCADDPSAVEVRGTTGTGVTGAASRLLAAGEIEVVVGTRGLFGEGWDCPAVNTLVDLTAVATASATQQLRGRTLRLDPQWPEKVAHNWTVTAILPPTSSLSAQPDAARLRRKHARLWGLDADRPGSVVRGLGAALDRDRRVALDAVLAKDPGSSVRAVDALVGVLHAPTPAPRGASAPPTRTRRRPLWSSNARIALRPSRPPSTPLACWAAGSEAPWRCRPPSSSWRSSCRRRWVLRSPRSRPCRGCSCPSRSAVPGVARDGRAATPRPPSCASRGWCGPRCPRAAGSPPAPPHRRSRSRVQAATGSASRSGCRRPDSMISAPSPTPSSSCADPSARPVSFWRSTAGGGSWWVRRVLEHAGRGRARQFLSVPDAIGRRRDDAVRFHGAWQVHVGPAVLHEFSGPENLALMSEARRAGGFSGATRSMWQWR